MGEKESIDKNFCVSCGCCIKVCPTGAVKVINGLYAEIDDTMCEMW